MPFAGEHPVPGDRRPGRDPGVRGPGLRRGAGCAHRFGEEDRSVLDRVHLRFHRRAEGRGDDPRALLHHRHDAAVVHAGRAEQQERFRAAVPAAGAYLRPRRQLHRRRQQPAHLHRAGHRHADQRSAGGQAHRHDRGAPCAGEGVQRRLAEGRTRRQGRGVRRRRGHRAELHEGDQRQRQAQGPDRRPPRHLRPDDLRAAAPGARRPRPVDRGRRRPAGPGAAGVLPRREHSGL